MGENEEKRKKDLRDEARDLFKMFYEKTKDVQKATAQTIKEITDKTFKGVQPSKEKVKEITEGIVEGIQETRKQMGGRLESVLKTLQDLTSKATASVMDILSGVIEGVEEATEKERAEECLRYIKGRRSVVYFDPSREVPEETIREILDIASLTPSSYNLQPWEVVVVRSKEMREKLKEVCHNQQKVLDASVDIVIVANLAAAEEHVDRILESWAELGYISADQKEELRQRILQDWSSQEKRKRKAIRDAAMYAMSVMIVARYFGLETHPLEGFDEAKLKKLLNIGKDRVVPLIIAAGYRHPEKEPPPRAYRFRFEEYVRVV